MERITKSIRFPKELEARITEYQKQNEISTFTQALFELVRIALETKDFQDEVQSVFISHLCFAQRWGYPAGKMMKERKNRPYSLEEMMFYDWIFEDW